jgi:hypothetical protein
LALAFTRGCTKSRGPRRGVSPARIDLDRFWDENDVELQKLFQAFRLAALGLSAEIVILIAMVSDNLF